MIDGYYFIFGENRIEFSGQPGSAKPAIELLILLEFHYHFIKI